MPMPDETTEPLAALDALEAILCEETQLLEAGAIAQALALGPVKAAAAEALRRALPQGGGPAADQPALRARQETFRRILSANLAIIATARSVAETLLREVSTSVAPRAPRTYAPPGRARSGAPAGAPITLSRTT